jgi:GNAT superfamily N-acetyltransferase
MTVIDRAKDSVERYGFGGVVHRAAILAGRSARQFVSMREQHVWYRLMVGDSSRPRVALGCDLTLVRAGIDDLWLLEQLPAVGAFKARLRLASRAQLWLVRDGDRAAFSCWTFAERAPVLAARGGWLGLPPAVVVLEESVTSPDYRGRNIAPAAWSGIADQLASEGVTMMITKVAEDNIASRRAVEKAGFREGAIMRARRLGPSWHVAIEPLAAWATTLSFLEALIR